MGDATFKYDMTDIENMQEMTPEFKRELLESMGGYMLNETRQRFRDCKSPDGSTWPATKFKSDRSVRTLYGHGDLFRSIVKYMVDETTIGVGSNLIYASVHNMGAKFIATAKQSMFLFHNVFKAKLGSKAFFSWRYHIDIPKREFLGINSEDTSNMTKIIETKLLKGINHDGD